VLKLGCEELGSSFKTRRKKMAQTSETNQRYPILETMVEQIGMMNILAISGGRKIAVDDVTLHLPVSNGYVVEIQYDEQMDTYTVRRVFRRGGKQFIKGEVKDVYCDELGEVAYQAHAFQSYEFGEAA